MTSNYCGRFEVRRQADGSIAIERADPRIVVTAELLDHIAAGDLPYASLNGDVLRFDAADRTVIYRIGAKVPHLLAYNAEWPD